MKKIIMLVAIGVALTGCESPAERQIKEMQKCQEAGFSGKNYWYGFTCEEPTLSAQTILQVQNLKERVKALEEKLK